MIEIKFRAWDILEKKLVNIHQLSWEGGEIDVSAGGHWHDKAEGRYEIMQYTGLRDKNGKEIYEDDILCRVKKDGTQYNKKYVVRKRWNGWFDDLFYRPDFTCEVIGNIYENPEFLDRE